MNLEDLDEVWFEINSLKPKFSGSPANASRVATAKGPLRRLSHWDCRAIQRAAEIETRAAEIEAQIKDSQVTVFDREIKLRSAVLKELGHIDDASVLQLKGRAACEVDTADELMASELMLEGAFNALDASQVVAVASCLVPVENTQAIVEVQVRQGREATHSFPHSLSPSLSFSLSFSLSTFALRRSKARNLSEEGIKSWGKRQRG